ncbi:MAG: hypothetical protein V4564_08260 [Pseudomonadota bacterium]|uniref:hypothetical protein n=1 Tax=Sphingomonas sp. ERG5 TaxID=1381597 RepID=UPI00054C5C5B|nr:hypothetical protein [Sphingomonas sp. ERG5]
MATPPKKPAPRRKPAITRKPAAARKPNVAPLAAAAATPAPVEAQVSATKPKTPAKPRAKAPARPKTTTRPSVAAATIAARNAAVTTLDKARQAVVDASPAKKWTAAAILGGIGAAVTATLLTLRGSTPKARPVKKTPSAKGSDSSK